MAWVELVVMMGMPLKTKETKMLIVGDRVMLEPPKWAPQRERTKLGRVVATHPAPSVNIGIDLGTVDIEWDDGTRDGGYGIRGTTLKKIDAFGRIIE